MIASSLPAEDVWYKYLILLIYVLCAFPFSPFAVAHVPAAFLLILSHIELYLVSLNMILIFGRFFFSNISCFFFVYAMKTIRWSRLVLFFVFVMYQLCEYYFGYKTNFQMFERKWKWRYFEIESQWICSVKVYSKHVTLYSVQLCERVMEFQYCISSIYDCQAARNRVSLNSNIFLIELSHCQLESIS